MQLTRSSLDTNPGPSDWFTGSVFFEPGEEHWHGAAPNRFMTHLAMQEVAEDGTNSTWGDHVTDEEYGAAPAA